MIAKKYDAEAAEKRWQDYWQQEGIYKFNPDSEKEVYSIDTPPPTVNGKIHIGHIFSYSQAEMMARYMRMTGHNVFYPMGFDDNGLPTERLVEKKYNMRAHETTREHFTMLCLNETKELEKQFKELFISAGFGCDWDYEYSTISREAQIISQKSFIDLYKKKKAYYKKAPALWCTECRTAVAQAELETREQPSVFNYIRFYLANKEMDDNGLKFIDSEMPLAAEHSEIMDASGHQADRQAVHKEEYIEIATTRPELLAACKCIFIHPDDEKNKWLLNEKIIVPIYNFIVPVFTDDKVEMGKGSGLVMCCTFGDLTDLEWYKKHDLGFTEAIYQDGTMSAACGKYEGLKVEEARAAIIEDLKAGGYMIRQEGITHNVAVHERCGIPIEIRVKEQWFIDILSNKQKYIDAGNEIKWYPEHMKLRYMNWVCNLELDWCISRQRFYGVPFPVWYCNDCKLPVVADYSELPVNPLTMKPKKSCACGCGELMPEADIMDTWATSSVTPFILLAQLSNEGGKLLDEDEQFIDEPKGFIDRQVQFRDEADDIVDRHEQFRDEADDIVDKHTKFLEECGQREGKCERFLSRDEQNMLPMGLRPNAHDIIRTWDFYTIVKSLYHTDTLPWRDIMISGHVMAGKPDGKSSSRDNEKISKRKENQGMDPPAAIAEHSADAVRLWAGAGSLGNDIVFSEDEFKNGRKLITKLWNAAKFVIMHLEGFEKTELKVMLNPYDGGHSGCLQSMDEWAAAAFNQMYGRYKKYLDQYEIGLALLEIQKFFWGFCDDYIEIVKNRLYKPEVYGEEGRKSGLWTLYNVFLGILKCFAIYIPHVTEEIYQGYFIKLCKEKSIHCLQLGEVDYYKGTDFKGIKECLDDGNAVLEVISQLRRYKSEKNMSLKEELDNVQICVPRDISSAMSDIMAVCACRHIDFILKEGDIEVKVLQLR